MEAAHIPKVFWYSLSLCMVSATAVLLVIAAMSSSVSIEIANAKINISSAIAQTKAVKGELEAKNAQLIAANELIQSKLDALEASGQMGMGGFSIEEIEKLNSEILGLKGLANEPNSSAFKNIETRIEAAERFLQ